MTRLDTPQPGFFRYRKVRNGPWVGACIARFCTCTVNGGPDNGEHDWQPNCDRFPPLVCFVDGAEAPAHLHRVWLYGKRIEQTEYEFMAADSSWARKYAPDDPKARSHEAVDVKNMPIPEF